MRDNENEMNEIADSYHNRALAGAFVKGYKLGDMSECPYRDKRGGRYREQVTFSRAFRNAFQRGVELRQATDRRSESGSCAATSLTEPSASDEQHRGR